MYSSKRYLAESEHYRITSEHEMVYLEFKTQQRDSITIGDFYGNPDCAMILASEEYAVIAGCGFIVYSLKEPFAKYVYSLPDNIQYFERYREPGNIKWIEAVYQSGLDEANPDEAGKYFRYLAEENRGFSLNKVNVETKAIEVLGVYNYNEE